MVCTVPAERSATEVFGAEWMPTSKTRPWTSPSGRSSVMASQVVEALPTIFVAPLECTETPTLSVPALAAFMPTQLRPDALSSPCGVIVSVRVVSS